MISVVVPLYNKAPSIESTVASVLAQTWVNFELIIIDDGSTDDGPTRVCKFCDARIKLVRLENRGVSAARNAGARLASGAHIAFLDADDLWMPNHLEIMNALITEHSTVCDVFASGACTDAGPLGKQRIYSGPSRVQDYFEAASGPERVLSSSSFAVSRELFIASGGYNERLRYGEDVEFWCRLFLAGAKLAYSSTPTVVYRTSAPNRSAALSASLGLRYSDFSALSRIGYEGLYRGKLVMILIIDQLLSRSVRGALRTALREWRILHLALFYLLRLGYCRARRR